MAKRSSSGSSGRRGSSRTNSGGGFSRRKDSSEKPFRKSESKSTGRSSSFDKAPRGSFRKKDDAADNRSGQSRPFKKSDKPYGKREEGSSSESRGRSYGDRKPGFSSSPKRSSGSSFKKSNKPFKRRGEDSSESGSRSYGNKRSSFSQDKGERGNFRKSDKPFTRKSEDSSESDRKSSYGNRRSTFSKDKGEDNGFKKSGERSDRKNEGSSESRSINKRGDKFKKGPSFGLPYKRSYEKKGETSANLDNKSPDNFSDGVSEKPRTSRTEKSESEPKRFLKKAKGRYGADKSTESGTPSSQTEKIRLNRYIANSGICSRREADELIAMGLVTVNGKSITEMGYKVNPGDEVRYENKVLTAEKPVYILLNKPKGYLTTTSDPQERNTVMHIIGSAVKARIYPVGRLDRNTTGLLLLTNDGELADKLMHPSYNVKKIYKVELDKPLTKADLQSIREGVRLEEGRATVDDIAIVSDDGKTVGVELHIGWNRVIRRIFEHFEYQVVRLDRSVYAGLDKKDLGRGEWRYLTKEEIVRLKHYQ